MALDYDSFDRAPALPEKKWQRVTIPLLTTGLLLIIIYTIKVMITGHP